MIICRWFISLQLFLLCTLICLVGYDPPQSEAQTDSPQQSDQTSQSVTPKRAPRTLEAFQNAIKSGQVGTISGRALFKGELPPPKELRVTLNKKTCGHTYQSESLLVSEKRGIQNVVVSLLRIPKGLPTETGDKPIQIDQQRCVFIPHVLLVPAGTEFEALNSDPISHNFHTIGSHNKELNIMQTKTKRRRLPLTFPEPDTIKVICDVHSWMKAWIIVTEHPYYALTNADGQFRLENVPEGAYRIRAWHEELGKPPVQEVVVTTNQDAKVDFEFSQPEKAAQ
ncbi:hypothetical protein C6502_18395 [Candidatus Poribacteria bacterium]|nr:MAG: hypothetical protein C6502_18395 [Candidatus Poribacteria bacterium]